MSEKQPLHLASSLEALEKIALSSNEASKVSRLVYCRVADRLYDSACLHSTDEERQYVYYTRFIRIVNQISASAKDDKFISSRFGKQLKLAKEKLQEVKASLINRYQGKTAEPKMSISDDDDYVPTTAKKRRESDVFDSEFITTHELYRSVAKQDNLLVIDLRTSNAFTNSHLKYHKTVNIPYEIIQNGFSAFVLGKKLPEGSKELFDQRHSFRALVLMDLDTDSLNFSISKMVTIYTILTKWDTLETGCKVYILNGGFLRFIDEYPTFTTNPHVYLDLCYGGLDELLGLKEIEYPHLPTEVELNCRKLINTCMEEIRLEGKIQNMLLQLKAAIQNNTPEETQQELHSELEKVHLECEGMGKIRNHLQMIVARYSFEEIGPFQEQIEGLDDSLKNLAARRVHVIKECEDAAEVQNRMQADAAARAAASARAAAGDRRPVVDRSSKPLEQQFSEATISGPPHVDRSKLPKVDRTIKPQNIEGSFIDLLYEKNSPNCGITGIYNIKNSCYQNALVQCLRHLPGVAVYCINKRHILDMQNRKGRIMRELSDLVSRLWLEDIDFIHPIAFYEAVAGIDVLYSCGNHEDIHQFMLVVLEGISEDTTCDVTIDDNAPPAVVAWHQQLGGIKNYITENFFHQVAITQKCTTCNKTSVRYDMENVFMLCVPQEMQGRPFHLKDLIEYFFVGDINNKAVCKDCKCAVEMTKRITKYPRFAILCLKRYLNQQNKFVKNEQPCFFSETISIGEVEYQLYSIAQHHGDLQQGHYTSTGKNPFDNKWYQFNDWKCQKLPSVQCELVRRQAYLFFYQVKNSKYAGMRYTK